MALVLNIVMMLNCLQAELRCGSEMDEGNDSIEPYLSGFKRSLRMLGDCVEPSLFIHKLDPCLLCDVQRSLESLSFGNELNPSARSCKVLAGNLHQQIVIEITDHLWRQSLHRTTQT